jgi:3-oxoacyl-[acyl-carrier protein] reductase
VAKLVDTAAQALGKIDILVNNAGGGQRGGFMKLTDDAWQAGIDLNLMSTIRCSRAVIPFMREQNWGRIINITSIVGKMIALPPLPNLVEYTTTKAAVISLSKTMAEDLAPHNILVNSVSPGPILTPMWENNARVMSEGSGKTPQDILDERASNVPLNRFGKPEEIAYMVAFLCSDKADYITGTNINIDGGSYRGIA